MSAYLEDLWQWARTAPLPVVLAITLALSVWVYGIDVEQRVEKARSAGVAAQVDKMDVKLDKLLDGVADLRAEQRVRAAAPVLASPAFRTTISPSKEK